MVELKRGKIMGISTAHAAPAASLYQSDLVVDRTLVLSQIALMVKVSVSILALPRAESSLTTAQ